MLTPLLLALGVALLQSPDTGRTAPAADPAGGVATIATDTADAASAGGGRSLAPTRAAARTAFAALGPAALPAPAATLRAGTDPARDTVRQRAIEYSDFYYTRLAIHRYASYATLPLFVTEYFLGQHLYDHPGEEGGTRSAHAAVAGGVAALFGVNTVTGVWNLWDSRHDPNGRTRRYVHALSMLVADAGFVWTGTLAPGEHEAERDPAAFADQRRKHRTVALASMGLSLASYAMMLFWKD
jgi:hypothetical protein